MVNLRSAGKSPAMLLLLGSLVFSLVALELGVRWLRPYRIPRPPAPDVAADAFEVYEPHGYRLRPNQMFSRSYPPGSPDSRALTVLSNDDGFRSHRGLGEQDERTRVLTVGDSYVFGLGVEESERFTELIEEMEPDWRMDNLGMNGYGPDLMLMALEHLAAKAMPDVVVLCLYTDSFRRIYPYYTSYGFELPRFTVRAGRLIREPPPKRRVWDSLHTIWQLRAIYRQATNWEWDVHTAIIDRVLELSTKDDFELLVVYLPGYWPDYEVDRTRRSWLSNYASEHGLPFLDLTGPLHEAGRAEAFIPNDIHWNPRGHQIVALALHDFLAKNIRPDTKAR